jgi:tetratricopeptide (TPR) repeat protein
MTAGLPGVGIGGIFYVVSALLMPVRAAVLTARGRRADARWGLALRQAGIAAGILGALWFTGWLIAAALNAFAPHVLTAAGRGAGGAAVGNVVKVTALALSLVTLTLVVGAVQLARLVVTRPDPAERVGARPRRGARAAAILLAVAGAALVAPRAATAQQPRAGRSAAAHMAAADSAYRREQWEAAEREYGLALAADSALSRPYYQLAMLRRHRDPSGAVRLLERYVALQPRDAWGWAALGDVQRRAGRTRAALASWERARSLEPESVDASRVAAARAAVAATVEPLALGARDSDGDTQAGGRIRLTSPELGAGSRAWVSAGTKRVSGLDSVVSTSELLAGLQARPTAALRLEGSIGAAILPEVVALPAPLPGNGQGNGGAASGTSVSGPVFLGSARLRWRDPGNRAALDLRGGRTLLDVTPLLAGARAYRDEVGAEGELRVAGPLRVRGFGRTGRIVTAFDDNTRDLFGGAALLALPSGIEVGVRAQEIRFGAPSVSGYFAPEQMRVAEATAYIERESASGVSLALDLGAGAQRVTDWGTPAGRWSPALRGWAQLVVPVGTGRAFGVEVDSYDAKVGTEGVAPTSGRWRYASAAAWLRLAIP